MKKLKVDLSSSINQLKIVTQRLVNTTLVGGYSSVFKGRGLEFYDYRKYDQNDDASLIDWKATKRGNQILIKEFIEERNLNVFFLIDVSSSMIYSSGDKLKIEYAAELVATMSYAVLSAGDSVGFGLFNDRVISRHPPKQGFKQQFNLMKTIVDPSNYGGKYDLSEALKFTLAFLKTFSIVIIVSDFIGLKNDWKQLIKIAGKKYDLIGIMVRDVRDKELPDYHGNVTLGDPFSSNRMVADIDAIKDDYKRYAESEIKDIRDTFINSGSDFIELTTDKPFIEPITDLFMARARKHRQNVI